VASDPMEQFQIKKIFDLDLAGLNIPFTTNMVKDTTGPEAMKFFPFVFTIFFFILFANLIGMSPYAFTTTSHLAVTVALAGFTIMMVVVAGLIKNGFKWFKIFAPAGLPLPMYILIVPIEIISFLSRPITLAVRLFANMTAGHVMLKLFAIFAAFLVGKGGILAGAAIVPVLGTMGIIALEFLVAGSSSAQVLPVQLLSVPVSALAQSLVTTSRAHFVTRQPPHHNVQTYFSVLRFAKRQVCSASFSQ